MNVFCSSWWNANILRSSDCLSSQHRASLDTGNFVVFLYCVYMFVESPQWVGSTCFVDMKFGDLVCTHRIFVCLYEIGQFRELPLVTIPFRQTFHNYFGRYTHFIALWKLQNFVSHNYLLWLLGTLLSKYTYDFLSFLLQGDRAKLIDQAVSSNLKFQFEFENVRILDREGIRWKENVMWQSLHEF